MKYKEGDIFAMPIKNGLYLFGRVILDGQRLFDCDLTRDSHLNSLGPTVLVEIYSEVSKTTDYMPSPILIPGIYVGPYKLGTAWEIVSHNGIDCRDVCFPEDLYEGRVNEKGGQTYFSSGEIVLPLPFGRNHIGVHQTVFNPDHLADVCADRLGIDVGFNDVQRTALSCADLRFNEKRSEVYRELPISSEQTYYKQQSQLGLDIARLFN